MKLRLIFVKEEDLLPLSEAAAKDNPVTYTHQNCLRVHLDEVVFTASSMALLMFLQLPMTIVSGKPVPKFVFGNGAPPTFHAFLMCLVGAWFGSVCSIYIRKVNIKIARLFCAFAVLSMFTSFAIAFLCALWEIFKAGFTVFSGN